MSSFFGKRNFLKLDLDYIFRQGGWTSLHFALSSVLSLLLQVLVVNSFSKEDYGKYQYVFAVSGIIMSFSLQGLRTAMTRKVSQGDLSSFPSAVRVLRKFSVVLFLVHMAVAGYYFFTGDKFYFILLCLVSVTAPAISLCNSYTGYLQGIKDFRANAIFQLGSLLITSTAAALAIIVGKDIMIYAAASQITNLIVNYFISRRIMKSLPPQPISISNERELFKYGLHLSVVGILGSMTVYADKIIINYVGGPVSVAILTISSSLINKAKTFVKSLSVIVLPKIAEKKLSNVHAVFHLRTLQGLIFGLLSSLVLYFSTPYAFKILFPAYIEHIHFGQILAFEIVFLFVGSYHSAVLKGHGMVKPLYYITTINGTLKLTAMLIGGLFWAIQGIALARVLTTVLSGLIGYVYLALHMRNLHKV